MKDRLHFSFSSFQGYGSSGKTVEDVEREVRIFFKAGGTPAELLDDLEAYNNEKGRGAYWILADAKFAPVALAIDDFSQTFLRAASALARSANPQALVHAVRRGADVHLAAGTDGAPAIVEAAQICWYKDKQHAPEREKLQRQLYADATAMLEFLIEWGADVNATDHHGMTALMAAARVGHVQAVKLLLDNGAQVDAVEDNGKTALHYAAAGSQKGAEGPDAFSDPVETVRVLLANGADPMRRNFYGRTVLHTMAVNEEFVPRQRFDAVVQILLQAGAAMEARDHDGYTPLLLSMRNGTGAKVLVPGFIDAGADAGAKMPGGSGAGRLGGSEAKRVLKASLIAQKIGGAMDREVPPAPRTTRDTFGVL